MIDGGRWRNDAPPINTPVEIWYWNTIILAYYDGKEYRTMEGTEIVGVTHWRKRRA